MLIIDRFFRKSFTSKMAKEYVRGKSWVELMEEEEETTGEIQSEGKELAEEEKLLADKNMDPVEERLKVKKGNLDAGEVMTEKSEDQKLHKENKQDHPQTELNGKLEVSNIKVKTEMEASSTHEVPSKIILPNDKIKTEPGSDIRCNGDTSVLDIKQETNMCTIKIKSEVEEIDDNDRISKELDLMENELFNVQEKNSDSLKDRVSDSLKESVTINVKDTLTVKGIGNSVTKEAETHTFVHPETMVNGDHKATDEMVDTREDSVTTQTSPRKNRSTRKRKSSSNVGNNRRKYTCRDPSASSSSSGRSSNGRSSNATTPRKEKKQIEYENDPEILTRRQKQIDYGKNTIGYDRYRQLIPKERRTNRDPRTPPKHIKYSRRAWDGMVRVWRQQLHAWDPEPTDKEPTTLPDLNVSVDVSSTPCKRKIHSTVSSASGSTDDVGTDDFISLDYDDIDIE